MAPATRGPQLIEWLALMDFIPDEEAERLLGEFEHLSRDLALAEARIAQLERQLVAAGAVDPELGP